MLSNHAPTPARLVRTSTKISRYIRARHISRLECNFALSMRLCEYIYINILFINELPRGCIYSAAWMCACGPPRKSNEHHASWYIYLYIMARVWYSSRGSFFFFFSLRLVVDDGLVMRLLLYTRLDYGKLIRCFLRGHFVGGKVLPPGCLVVGHLCRLPGRGRNGIDALCIR